MRLGILGLSSRYWPTAFAGCAREIRGVELCAAADLGRSDDEIQATPGMSAAALAERFEVRLYHDPVGMIAGGRLDAVFVSAGSTNQADLAEVAGRAGVHFYVAKP